MVKVREGATWNNRMMYFCPICDLISNRFGIQHHILHHKVALNYMGKDYWVLEEKDFWEWRDYESAVYKIFCSNPEEFLYVEEETDKPYYGKLFP